MAETPLVHVIDDDASVRESLAFLLEAAGQTVRTYGSAQAFLDVAAEFPLGCVLTDVQMPGMNGLELQRRMHAAGVRLPVIIMTGHADVPVAVEALKAGATDFLEKPFDDAHLLAAVSSAMAASRQASEQAAAVADVRTRDHASRLSSTKVRISMVRTYPSRLSAARARCHFTYSVVMVC